MIEVTPEIQIPESELELEFVRGSGPGGQNINKVSTAVQLRFNVTESPSLPEDVKERLAQLAGNKLTQDGMLLIDARRFRTQEKNREDAIQRLVDLIQKAAAEPKTRKKTRPGVRARAARLFEKKRRAELKRTRRYHPEDWD